MNLLVTLSAVAGAALAWVLIALGIPKPLRPAFATAAFLGAWILCCLVAAHHPSTWNVLGSATAITASIGAVVLSARQLTGDCGGPGDHDDGGGGATSPPANPSGGSGPDSPDPDWWPDFEHQLDAYLRKQSREADRARRLVPA